jgi:OmpA-OmpF porin, OOP family
VLEEKPVNLGILLCGVMFEFNKADIRICETPFVLDEVAETLKDHPDIKVEIAGYTDWIGSQEYNLKLSQRRADAVRTYLISKGVAADRMTAVGYGKENPIASNETDEGRAMNRRIEFKILNQ